MRTLLSILVLVFASGAAQAQIKCWSGADGKRVCGDTPPPGAKVTTIKSPSAAPAPAEASKDAKKGPMTPAEQEADYRKRQAVTQKAAAKAAEERQEAALKRENCERARESLRGMESGQRVSRTNAQGERSFLDEAQMQQEIVKARLAVQEWCN